MRAREPSKRSKLAASLIITAVVAVFPSIAAVVIVARAIAAIAAVVAAIAALATLEAVILAVTAVVEAVLAAAVAVATVMYPRPPITRGGVIDLSFKHFTRTARVVQPNGAVERNDWYINCA